jgi:L-alanine-DL-glutamate epimerase-like enolase superfamily enzyme
MRLSVRVESWPLAQPFRITGHVFETAEVAVAELSEGEAVGRGEAAGVYYRGETAAGVAAEIEAARPFIEGGIDREGLRTLMPAGGARNALDAALWDLESQLQGVPVWVLAGLKGLRPLVTTHTVSAGAASDTAEAARGFADARAIKLKLTPEDPADCVAAVRAARPDVWLGVDANQGLTRATLEALMPVLAEAGVSLIEQPVPVGEDAQLDGLSSPIPIAADESCQGLGDLAGLAGRYDVVNLKLDKCGGLTEGLLMAAEARRLGLDVMVGCMSGTSLAMAPGFVLGQVADFVDLDSPLFLTRDRPAPAAYDSGRIWCPPELWGGGTYEDALRGARQGETA